MGEHLTPGELEGRFLDDLPPERLKEAVAHLIGGCQECRAPIASRRVSRRKSTVEMDSGYDAALARAEEFARILQRLPRNERKRFQKALSLLESGHDVLALALQGNMEVAGLGVYEALLARSWAVRFDDPGEMRHLAKVAVEVIQALDPAEHGEAEVMDLQARAWGEYANACRVGDDLREAQQAFGKAFAHAKQGTQNSFLKARLLDLEASLLGSMREFEIALMRLEAVPKLYLAVGEPHLAGRASITRAIYTHYSGRSAEAARIASVGLKLIDADRDPDLLVLAAFNLLNFLVCAGEYRQAKRILFEHRPHFLRQSRQVSVKARWVEGQLSYGLDELVTAEIACREAKQGLLDLGMKYQAAIAALDLAMTLMRLGKLDEAEKEVIEASQVFASLEIRREFLGSVILLEEAFRLRFITVDLLETTVRYIRNRGMKVGLNPQQ